MVGFSSWFSRGARKSAPSGHVEPTSAASKVIRGRVTKHCSSARGPSPAKRERYQDLVSVKEEESDGEPHAMSAISAMTAQDTPELRGGAGSFPTSEPVARPNDVDVVDLLNRFNRAVRDQEEREQAAAPDGTYGRLDGEESSDSDETDSEYGPEEGWRIEQVFLNQVLNARNEYTLMPSTWKMHFKGIPLPDGLFYIKTQNASIRPRIYARTDRLEYRGALALRKFIDIHGRIRDLRREQFHIQRHGEGEAEKQLANRIVVGDIIKQIRRTLEDALQWASLDGDTIKYGQQLPPNVKIIELKDGEAAEQPDSERLIQTQMCRLGAQWRRTLDEVPEEQRSKAPVIFGFVIFKHILFIVTMDANDPEAICHIPCQLNMAEKNQHQWNALAIMVTICWARDLLVAAADKIPHLTAFENAESSDPDA
ncbi:hypothetical protein F5B20DRAFT_572635 [Whalleya microplaca]|nr:hypothetical protein F5B20DRAFT_572635 [Whalleya microplaca]